MWESLFNFLHKSSNRVTAGKSWEAVLEVMKYKLLVRKYQLFILALYFENLLRQFEMNMHRIFQVIKLVIKLMNQ